MMKVAGFAALAVASAELSPDVLEAFKGFQAKFNKKYEDPKEWNLRAGIFASNLDRVAKLNTEHVLTSGEAVHGVTKFSDLTPEEFKATYLTYKPRLEETVERVEPNWFGEKAASIDWRDSNAVTAVKDQGQCGSCWAFSATEAIESYYFLNGGELTELSAQQITSCDTTDGGCDGGNSETAYEYVMSAGGLETEANYPYTSGSGNSGKCKAKSGKEIVGVASYTSVKKGETNLETSLNTGPVSVCLAAEAFQSYSSGILSRCAGQVDHCVQAVGYTADYWIVRNSWATDWGEEGYIRIKRGKDLCKISDDVTFPTF